MTIPSDLGFDSQALSAHVGNPCESPSPRPEGLDVETLADLVITLKFCFPSAPLAERQRNAN